MALTLHVLASGSKGNASIIQDSGTGRALLIDCGISKQAFFGCCEELGFGPHAIEAVLITHEHTDHTKGLGVVLRGLARQEIRPQVYVSARVAEASRELTGLRGSFDFQNLREDAELSLAGLKVSPFLTSHDAVQSYGFRIEDAHGDALGYMTDTGTALDKAREYLEECRILALESNYDLHMLKTGPYPSFLKKRILSDKGHLSNEQAAEVLESLLANKLKQVVAMHISENNNTYQIPRETFEQVVARNTHPAHTATSYQYRTTSIY